jgi:hypothetical protein
MGDGQGTVHREWRHLLGPEGWHEVPDRILGGRVRDETELTDKIGVVFSRGEIWQPYMFEDRNLVTGQNPHSAAILGRRLLEVLAARGASAEHVRVDHSSAAATA